MWGEGRTSQGDPWSTQAAHEAWSWEHEEKQKLVPHSLQTSHLKNTDKLLPFIVHLGMATGEGGVIPVQ